DFHVLERGGLVDCERVAVLRGVPAGLLDRQAGAGGRVAHDGPITVRASAGAPERGISRRHATPVPHEIDLVSGDCAAARAEKAECDGKRQQTAAHAIAPTRYRSMPARQHAASVGIIPTLKRKIAMAAAIDSATAQG